MMHFCRLLRGGDYRTSLKIADEFNNVLNRSGWGFDHVAIDVGALTGSAGRLTRDLIGQERDTETVKIVHRQITNVILRRIQPKKSLAIFLDGSEPLWKLRHMRLYPGKKFDGKFYRSAASPMVYLLEEKLRHVGPELRTPPREFVISGAAVPGPVEGKISAWMLDLATRTLSGNVASHTTTVAGTPPEVSLNDTFCLVGGTDLFLSSLGATPFHNITTLTLHQGEMKSLSLSESLEWLSMDHLLKGEALPSNGQDAARQEMQKRLASARTDIVLLYLMANGISATDLPGLGVNFKDIMEAYAAEEALNNDRAYLFEESPKGITLLLRPAALERILARATRKTTSPARFCRESNDYLEILLQTHAMICSGGIKNFYWTPDNNDAVPEKPQKILVERFIGHLKHLAEGGTESARHHECVNPPSSLRPPYVSASVDWTFALTGVETLLVSAPKAEMIEQIVPLFTRGHSLPSGIAESIVGTKNVLEAIEKARGVLQGVMTVNDAEVGENALREHPAFQHHPSHYFLRTPGSRGPPPGWAYQSINLGIRAAALGVRYRTGSGATALTNRVLDATSAPTKSVLFVHDGGDGGGWREVPCGGTHPSSAFQSMEELSTLRVVTWNVQFSRHSGERTPLGREGIDWCTLTRYVALAKTLESLDADVIGMQEVEPMWLKFLSEQQWVKERYALSCGEGSHIIQPWGVMFLVNRRLRVESVQHENLPAFSGHISVMPEITVTVSKNTPLTIGALHLLAPYNQNNINNRTTQLKNLTERMRVHLSAGGVPAGAVIMGDFNDCEPNSFTFPPEMGFKDAWSLLHPEKKGKEGYTIDGDRNPYAGKIIEQEFFGRADRVLFVSPHLQPILSELIGTTSVRSLGITKQVNCDKDVPEYLYPSDHFGLLVEFQVM